jgi:hypothetical protein
VVATTVEVAVIAAGSALCGSVVGAVVPAWMGRIVNRRADQAELAAAVRILLEEVSATKDRFQARTALGAHPGKAVPSTWEEQKRVLSRLLPQPAWSRATEAISDLARFDEGPLPGEPPDPTARLPRVVGACEHLATALGGYADIGRPEWQRGVLQGTPFGHRRH